METKEQPPVQNRPPPSNNQDIFANYSNKPSSNHDPFSMDPPSKPQMNQKQSSNEIFGNDLLGGNAPAQNLDPFDMTPQPVNKAPPKVANNQDDLDIFFGTSTNQPIQPAMNIQNRPSNNMPGNKNDVSGFTVYNAVSYTHLTLPTILLV